MEKRRKGRPAVPTCNMDCFNCIFADCINNRPMTQKEKDMLNACESSYKYIVRRVLA